MLQYQSLYQVNTRVLLTELSSQLGRRATLDDIEDKTLEQWQECGFQFVWLLSVWQIGPRSQGISRANVRWLHEFQSTLTDLCDDDIGGSGFAIQKYSVHRNLGGNEALHRLRNRMKSYGLRLILDFVPNHTGPDHPWVNEHPDYFVQGTDQDLEREPDIYTRLATKHGEIVFAMGRDPYFPGWIDTLQLNYGNRALQTAMQEELERIALQCDGVRCDMAMLLLPEVFQRTWQIPSEPFWPTTVQRIRAKHPKFTFIAEVYWDLEWELMQQGFDFCYDKRLHDSLRAGDTPSVRSHLHADLAYQNRLVRFLENHDEPRVASAFSSAQHAAASVICFLVPGMRFFHHGQLEGKRVRISPHLIRGPAEAYDTEVAKNYRRLLSILRLPIVRKGAWKRLEPLEAWPSNFTHQDFVSFQWLDTDGSLLVVVVNYSDHMSQCRVRLPDLGGGATRPIRLQDLWDETPYVRDSHELSHSGLFVELPAWGIHVLRVEG
ncbi:MAG: alpha-amylase family glycosyl hydrolase [Pirellula sp.]